MEYNLDRFVKAQERDFNQALKEIMNGHKESHWIWYIFPQLKGLGQSYNSNYYGIVDIEEAKAYLKHDKLGYNLKKITEALLMIDNNNPKEVMGSGVDSWKLQSSMTLFAKANPENKMFEDVLKKFYHGKYDEKTLELLNTK